MPLSPPADREHIHTRKVTCTGYRRADGLWDIEGHMTDVKTYAFPNKDRGGIAAGEPIHEMWLRVTLDDDMLIHAVEAVTDHSPFTLCPSIAPSFSELKGLRIDKGFMRELRSRFGGRQGCTHLVELFGPLATTAFQTIYPLRKKRMETEGKTPRPGLLDTCHALASDSEVVRREWPEFYTGPKAEA
ncbi:DUF2889 domain-containing protein [Telmatospirillum sp. J64-1]|uniref:DUF2889 domain-containing protein n=1 Tax=Telmatospirillum sp. J64-1 TaxID=2502183 RepID=UPI00115CA875|nr:DUF2889 domain-containing protein [Telmatospirillum sp. J64-1]